MIAFEKITFYKSMKITVKKTKNIRPQEYIFRTE